MTLPISKLESSIPANNTKIIEIYNKLRSGQLSVNSDYQRKLVWKKQHKFDFIDTILCNFPFPEVYLAPGSLDQEKLILVDEIVDGQQRLTTIRDYINGVDVFSLPRIPIKRFSEFFLSPNTKAFFTSRWVCFSKSTLKGGLLIATSNFPFISLSLYKVSVLEVSK